MRRTMMVAGAMALLAGCGGDSDEPATPAACLGPAGAYLRALESAPNEVRLGDATPISDCLVEDQPGGALQTVGKSIVDAATDLNAQARRDPGGEGSVQLGYLVGAVQEGASSTGGIHQDLVLRLDAAARFTGQQDKPFSAEFERAYGEGYAAGQTNG